MADRRSIHVAITGRVQGVGYRAWLRDAAGAAGLDGWVRNRRGGEVEAVLSGPPGAVEAMVAACWRGPDWAKVAAVDILSEAAEPAPGFTILPTE